MGRQSVNKSFPQARIRAKAAGCPGMRWGVGRVWAVSQRLEPRCWSPGFDPIPFVWLVEKVLQACGSESSSPSSSARSRGSQAALSSLPLLLQTWQREKRPRTRAPPAGTRCTAGTYRGGILIRALLTDLHFGTLPCQLVTMFLAGTRPPLKAFSFKALYKIYSLRLTNKSRLGRQAGPLALGCTCS